MEFEKEILQKAANDGARKVTEAFSKFSGAEVEASVSKFETAPLKESLGYIKLPENHSVVAYAQLLSGVPGASILMLSQEDAISLVDLLNNKPIGTTAVLSDIDRSAIKETLNILSNSYMTALEENSGLELGLGVPSMITSTRLNTIIEMLIEKGANQDDVAVIFETSLVITEHKIRVSLYIVFNKRLAELINEQISA